MSQTALYLVVALGGALGATLRVAAGGWALRALGAGFPFGTLGVNVVGGLAMGLVAAIVETRGSSIAPWFGPAAMGGLLGGFTTFSAFALDAVALVERGETAKAAAYVVASVSLAILALVLGLRIGRALA